MTLNQLHTLQQKLGSNTWLARISFATIVALILLGLFFKAMNLLPPKLAKVHSQFVIVAPLDIGSQHVLGLYAANPNDLPISDLPLKLQGTSVVTTDPNASIAIISDANDEAKAYHVGDQIPDGASIHAIDRTQVVISHNGRLERLLLPIPKLSYSSPEGIKLAS